MSQFYECPVCTANMELTRVIRTATKHDCSIKRYECDVCGNSEVVFSDGYRDGYIPLNVTPRAIKPNYKTATKCHLKNLMLSKFVISDLEVISESVEKLKPNESILR